MMVHDLRNPLTAATLALDTLAIAKNPEDQRNTYLQPQLRQKLLQRAREQLKSIDRLISDVLQLSLGEVADIQLHPQRLDLAVLTEAVVQQVTNHLQSKQQIIVTDIPQDLPPIYADPERIQQVLINLLDNAIK
jgi:two-component system clock-associated histidine kinase SasA